jgi:Zn-finger protein
VIFNYDFEIAKYPVTFEEYDLFCEDTGKEKPDDEGWGRGNRPVINVSWHNAKVYCEWLSEKTGENYRLPTEAEWEYSCRAGTTTKWSFGDDESELEKYAWYNKNSDGKTHEVGQKPPNPWGLYDMHGNVWEWCEDDYVDSYEKTPRDGKAFMNNKGGNKVLRGASWGNDGRDTRSAYRSGYHPAEWSHFAGFRLLRTLPSDLGDIVTNTTVKKSKKTMPKGDVTFKCEKCSTSYALNCDELDWEAVESHERQMGAEVNYEAHYEIDCENCSNSMSITFNCWEYPIGAENYRDVNGEGVKDIKGDCCLDFHESDRMEYIYNSIEEIKKWFFENYEDPANSLPHESKEGGYQWIHGGPVDTEEAIYEHFREIYSEEILNKAIDEIGKYEEWSPIPQSEEEFQDALSNWVKKKVDEDES